MKIKLPNTFALLFGILALIAAATWFVPGGKYQLIEANGRTVVDPTSFAFVASHPQGLGDLLMAPAKGFAEAGLIIGFVLITGGAFSVLQRTQAIDAFIGSMARAHERSPLVRAAIIPVFVTLFSLGGATFGMNEEAIPFVLIFIPLALALGYDTVIGISIPFIGSQVGFAAAFLNPFNVGIAQGIAGVPVFSGIAYRLLVWLVLTTATIAFLMWYAARIKARPSLSPTYALDQDKRASAGDTAQHIVQVSTRHRCVLAIFALALGAMVVGVVRYGWFIEQIAALFLLLSLLVARVAGMSSDELAGAFVQGARDLVGTALVIALARATLVIARDAQVIDTLLYWLTPLVGSSSPVWAAHKMFAIQTVINFFIHSGSGQAALTMPIMAPLADLVGVSRQTAVLAFQLGELTTPMIPTSGITVGVLALARVPWTTWARWMIPLQLVYIVLALALLAAPVLAGWH